MDVHEILLDCLEKLDSDEMDLFKWHLTKRNRSAIPKSRLEKKSRCDVVECMIQHYQPDGARKRTLVILEKMRKMNCAKELREKLAPRNPGTKKKVKNPATSAPKKTVKRPKKANATKPKAAKPKAGKSNKAAPKKK